MRRLPPDGLFKMDPGHRAEIANFFNRPEGESLFDFLTFMVPSVLEKGTSEEMLVRSGKVAGAQEQLTNILRLISPDPEIPKETTTPAYPSLDDEKAWKQPA